MNMERINRGVLKRAARENMRGVRPSALGVTAVFLLLTSVVSMVVNFVVANPAATMYSLITAIGAGMDGEELIRVWLSTGGATTAITLFLNILMFLYSAVMSFGYNAYTLRRTDGEETRCGDLLCGFSQVGRVISMQLVILGFSLVWCMATVLPAVMLGSMGMFFAVMLLGDSMAATVVSLLVFYLLLLGAVLFATYLINRYAMAPYILADNPEIGGMEAVRRSRVLMRGRLGEIFVLSLSFLGWLFLGMIIVAIVSSALWFVLITLYAATWDPFLLAIGAYGAVIMSTLVSIPYDMWYLSYRTGTFAQYYRFLAPKAILQTQLEADRPEPF